ncbi:TPA: hypothetical protein DIS56_03220 [Candidatus Saccharibacteria bacterium]|nr:hypothetical protein [Candidatus Saccharibacteria bacterium]
MPKFHYFIISVLLVLSLSLAHLVGNPGCAGNLEHDQTVKVNNQVLPVQKADSQTERQKGLSGLDCIGPNEGMLFIFDRPGHYSFWMKDTRFAIDIVWLSADKKVVDQQLNIKPSTYPQTFTNDKPAKYVLEIPAGQADHFGSTEGNQLSF